MAPSARSSGYSTPRSGRTSDDVTRPLRSSSPDHERDDADDGIDSDDAELLAAEAHVGSGAAGIAGAGNGDGRIGGFTKFDTHSSTPTTRSPYRLTTSERARGLANRILFSRYYIIFYLVMTGLSLATVILSLKEGDCPGTAWHILEIVVNGGMVLEVGTRWVGFGRQYPMTALNVIDLLLTVFCVFTLILVFFFSSCGGSKLTPGEEVLDTLFLVLRNGVQFWRLGTILRRSGQSLLHAPKPIDLSQARAAAFDLDLNLDDDEALAEHHINNRDSAAELGQASGSRTYFDAADEMGNAVGREAVIGNDRSKGQVGYAAGRENLSADDEAQWDRMG